VTDQVPMISDLPDGLMVVVKRDCETCVTIAPALDELALTTTVTLVSQDDPSFPIGHDVIDDRELQISWALQTEVTPTLYRIRGGEAELLAIGWRRDEWRTASGVESLGETLPDHRPGCGSRIFEPGVHERLAAAAEGRPALASRLVGIGDMEDVHEAMHERGWSDGLPLVPPTRERVEAMLSGTTRAPQEVVATVPPNYAVATVEKIAVNAVMAGCKPEYLPVVLSAVEAICTEEFNIHGVAATTFFSGPIIIVNGPVASRIGMNSSFNALGPGNRANGTIGRAVNLVVRNLGGAKPGGVDRSMQGHPAKWTLCFAEREDDSPWPSFATSRGIRPGTDAVSVFAGQGPTPVADQISRQPESLARSFALSLQTVWHAKLAGPVEAIITMSPEHVRVFSDAGWDKGRTVVEIIEATRRPGDFYRRGADGVDAGLTDAQVAALETDGMISKFAPDALSIVRVGSGAGLFSGILSSWARSNSSIVTRPVF
jgi:hypothetical protein